MSESAAHLPAEWAPQVGVLLTWPHEDSGWGAQLGAIEAVMVRIAAEVAGREAVVIGCRDGALGRRVRGLLRAAEVDLARVHLHAVPSANIWARDHGPITLVRSGWPLLLDFESEADDAISRGLHALGAFDAAPMTRVDLALAGGSVETDGEGTLLITRRCLLAAATRGGLAEAELCDRLGALFGRERVLQVGDLEDDDAAGVIDMMARFVNVTTIAYQGCDDPGDPRWASLQRMAAELAALRSRGGAPYRLVPLPWPRARVSAQGRPLPLSYANFLILNNAVLVPTYDDPADAQAIAALTRCFPGRAVVGIDCLAVVERGRSLHGLTMQLPLPLSLGPDTA
jgi:agmatine deiminase